METQKRKLAATMTPETLAEAEANAAEKSRVREEIAEHRDAVTEVIEPPRATTPNREVRHRPVREEGRGPHEPKKKSGEVGKGKKAGNKKSGREG